MKSSSCYSAVSLEHFTRTVLEVPRFSQGLAQDPTTRRIWFGIATAHDKESHDDRSEDLSS
ncbi:hypothetical protein EJ110_NYTH47827 [Nymphaea thermarum]|nr:hypothetical protein EJ110_NYTH47827 [Nymphaea thermarum]